MGSDPLGEDTEVDMTELEMTAVQAAPKEERKRTKKVFASLAAVSLVGVAGVAGTTAALSDTTENTLNEFDAAFIELTDNDAGSFMYDVDNQEPGDFVERCIRITYVGGAPADLKLALSSGALDAGAANLNVTIEDGSGVTDAFAGTTVGANEVGYAPNCTGFTPAGAALFTGTLDAFQAAHNSQATGLPASAQLAASTVGSTVDYRIRVELDAGATVTSANYLSGTHTYTWYADQV